MVTGDVYCRAATAHARQYSLYVTSDVYCCAATAHAHCAAGTMSEMTAEHLQLRRVIWLVFHSSLTRGGRHCLRCHCGGGVALDGGKSPEGAQRDTPSD